MIKHKQGPEQARREGSTARPNNIARKHTLSASRRGERAPMQAKRNEKRRKSFTNACMLKPCYAVQGKEGGQK